jgi:hypothetical protein
MNPYVHVLYLGLGGMNFGFIWLFPEFPESWFISVQPENILLYFVCVDKLLHQGKSSLLNPCG